MTNSIEYGTIRYNQEREKTMTYEECLEFCTKRMCVMGYFPNEIEEAAKEMFKADALYQAREEEN